MFSRGARLVAGVSGVILISRLLGMAREIVIADRFGTSSQYDLYLIAIMLPALAYGVLNFAFYYLLVPYLTRLFQVEAASDESSGRRIWSVFNGTVIASLLIAAAIIIFAPLVMPLWTSGDTATQLPTVIWYARLLSAIVVLATLEAFLRAVLNARQVFTYPAGGWIVFNLFFISAVILTQKQLSIGALALGQIGGLVCQNIYLALRVIASRCLPRFRLSLSKNELRAIWGTAGVLIIVELLNRSYFLIDRYFALPFGAGVVSALNYSSILVQLPDSIVGFAIASVAFPLFAADKTPDQPHANRLYRRAILGGLFLAVPIAVLIGTLAEPLVRVIFMRGQFDAASLSKTAAILRPHAATIAALFVVSTSIRACYARGWAKTVLAFTVILIVTKFLTTFLFSRWLAFPGISLATSVSQLLFAVFLAVTVRRRFTGAHPGLLSPVVRVVTAGAVMLMALLLLIHWY
ncbi:MAG: hypothetical protein D6800_04390, partial [Candidatus Zixiibacteriota bacterium]